jgi:uncharacterized protein
VETGIAIAAADLAFIDAVETRLVAVLGREAVLRCRVTHAGIVIELAAEFDTDAFERAREIGAEACVREGRLFAGVRPYAKGAAFLRRVADE